MRVTLAGDTVVLAGNHPESFGLSVQDGSMFWRQPLEGEVLSPGAMLPTGNLAMVSTRSRDKAWLTILDPSTGATLRKVELEAPDRFVGESGIYGPGAGAGAGAGGETGKAALRQAHDVH